MTTASELCPGTTQIGSLPHHNIDSAIEYSFRSTIPFLPQIPIRNPWEYMIPQALSGLPGLEVEKDGEIFLDYEVWQRRSISLAEKLTQCFSKMDESIYCLEYFEPEASTSSCWHPFLWELEERKTQTAKVQLAGPLTCQWVLKLKDGSPASKKSDLLGQIYRLITARALAMTRRLRSMGIKPLIYIDEPGLFAFQAGNPLHMIALQELKLLIHALKKDGAFVGLHCCSDTNWKSVLELGIDFLSIDTHLSLPNLLIQSTALQAFFEQGGKLSLGIIPSSEPSEAFHREFDPKKSILELTEAFSSKFGGVANAKNILKQSLFTPACGLALQSASNAEFIQSSLNQVVPFLLK